MAEQHNPGSTFPASGPNGRARAQSRAAAAALEVQPAATVRYSSRGFLVIIGRGERAYPVADQLAEKLAHILIITPTADAAADRRLPPAVEQLPAEVTRVEGYLGAFSIALQGADGEVELARLFPRQPAQRDMVLDLSDPPLLERAVLPVGYYAPGEDSDALAQAIAELSSMVGEFDKPQYFQYESSICAHARSGIQACTRCIDACPTLAIRSLGDTVEVNPYLCQGAGSCATACPTGAITYRYPQPRDTLERLRCLLRTYRDAGGKDAMLLIHDREEGRTAVQCMATAMPENVIPLECEETGSVGMEIWLAALAYGAAAIVLLLSREAPVPVVRELEQQQSYADNILRGMGYAAGKIRLLTITEPETMVAVLRAVDMPAIEQPAAFAGFNEKRVVIRLAVDQLHGQSSAPRPMVNLPTGAPFGEVTVEGRRCTLCMACVSQCPGKALVAGDDRPQLKFIEENCVQCGLCARSCPENAIAPSPRYLYDREARSRMRVLHEEEPFLCVRCGKAFATRSTIDRITAKLGSHPMFQGDAIRRIQMCEDCRVIAMLENEAGEGEQFAPGVRS